MQKMIPLITRDNILISFYQCNLQVWLLFLDPKTIALIVNYTCKSFIIFTSETLTFKVFYLTSVTRIFFSLNKRCQ